MKTRYAFLVLFLSSSIIIACSEEDEESKYELQGVWTLSRTIVEDCVDPLLNQITVCSEDCPEIGITETQIVENGAPIFTYRIVDAETLHLQKLEDDREFEVSFLVSDNILILTMDSEESTGCITTKIYRR